MVNNFSRHIPVSLYLHHVMAGRPTVYPHKPACCEDKKHVWAQRSRTDSKRQKRFITKTKSGAYIEMHRIP